MSNRNSAGSSVPKGILKGPGDAKKQGNKVFFYPELNEYE